MIEHQDGYIEDFISGKQVKATPEELDAVQVFSKQLVEDYSYPRENIQTRPQFRVKARPSDTKKEYPIDIGVFSSVQKNEDNILIIVECKKKTRKDGLSQLQDYLRFSRAQLGVWFNGDERLFIQKIEKSGTVTFREIPNIPKYGQRLEDIGRFKRGELEVPHNLKVVFRTIRNHLAGNFSGATRDEELARELINLIFCKIYDERFTKLSDTVSFRIGVDEDHDVVKKRIVDIFNKVKTKYNAVINPGDAINLSSAALAYVVGELQNYCIIDCERDVIAEAFETFIGYALKGAQGQFFTPRNVVRLMVEVANPLPSELLIDPACGSGGFLIESLRHMWNAIEQRGREYGWSDLAIEEEKRAAAIHCIRGIEKDSFLSKVAKAYMAIIGDGKGGIFCEDSLENPQEWDIVTRQNVELGKFDVLLTNPPFGKDIKVVGEEKLQQYNLAHKWKKEDGSYMRTNHLKNEEAPQIVFIERSLQLLRKGGRMGIILPETFFHAPNSKYVLQYMLKNNNITWLIDLPHNTFRPHNNAKCVIIFIEKGVPQQPFINMAVAEEIGHNHQGKEIYRWDYEESRVDRTALWDDIPYIIEEMRGKTKKYCFSIDEASCVKNGILVPRYYWTNKQKEIEDIAVQQNLCLLPLQQLIDEDILTYFDGHGSPPAEYKGMGEYPYIRVKDIVNWDVYKDPTARIPLSIYHDLKKPEKELRPQDILFVRRGSYRIGSVAMVSKFDTEVLLTREILVLRLIKPKNPYGITPYYLLYLLSHNLVLMQSKNKVLIETTLPNIADRWKELMLPIEADMNRRKEISDQIKGIIDSKVDALEKINRIQDEMGYFNT